MIFSLDCCSLLLVLTERTEHVMVPADLIRPHTAHLIIQQGGMGKKSLRAAMAQHSPQPSTNLT